MVRNCDMFGSILSFLPGLNTLTAGGWSERRGRDGVGERIVCTAMKHLYQQYFGTIVSVLFVPTNASLTEMSS